MSADMPLLSRRPQQQGLPGLPAGRDMRPENGAAGPVLNPALPMRHAIPGVPFASRRRARRTAWRVHPSTILPEAWPDWRLESAGCSVAAQGARGRLMPPCGGSRKIEEEKHEDAEFCARRCGGAARCRLGLLRGALALMASRALQGFGTGSTRMVKGRPRQASSPRSA